MIVGHSTNLVGLPTDLLASCDYNDAPLPLRISGVREFNPELFEMLGEAQSPLEAADAFMLYMNAIFGLDAEQKEKRGPRRYRSSFLKLISGWGFDSNGMEGAVLKGWVESRFGLLPTFHKEPIRRIASPAWIAYVEEKMSSRFHNNSIQTQLDLLYEYCQWALAAFFAPGAAHLTLHRGVNALERCDVQHGGDGRVTVRLNNLVSFTSDRDVAGCFGDTILTTRVPVSKILFFNDLLPTRALASEGEHLAIGGDYRVQANRL
jgi:NAD+---dinitrogen-reductase ADP-D-ribosyltransferase